MGVDIEHYVVIGHDFKTEKELLTFIGESENKDFDLYEEFDEQMEQLGLECICDGMNGDYLVVGKVLAKSSSGRWEDGCFDGVTEVENTEEKFLEVHEILNKHLCKTTMCDIKLIIFTHFH